jgi:ribulose-5-phosphate 4-epimerase/fuculose-1-phosphate aldolase
MATDTSTATIVSPTDNANLAQRSKLTAPLEPKPNEFVATLQFSKFPGPPKFNDKYEERRYLKGRLALAFRLFGKYNFDEGVAGHITLRDPVLPDHFWVNPFGLAFGSMRSSDLILVDPHGCVIDGGSNRVLNQAAYMIHHAVHTARPDVLCAAHSHSIYGRAFCALGREIDIITQDSCAFYKDHSVYRQFKGIVLAEEEGQNVARALGSGKACLLQNHGLLTCGQSIEAAVYWFVSLEKCCRVQLLADAAAGGRGHTTIKIDDEDATFTYKSVGTPRAGWFAAQPMFDLMAEDAKLDHLQ